MFCNQCGKENKDGTKFCVQCGAPLRPAAAPSGPVPNPVPGPVPSGRAGRPRGGRSFTAGMGIKALAALGIAAILALTAVFNIVRVYSNPIDIQPYNAQLTGNSSYGVWETKSCFYYIADGLIRVNKSNNTAQKVSNKSLQVLMAASDGIYCRDEDGKNYRMMDKASEIERVEELSTDKATALVFNGKCTYTMERDGSVIKRLNSAKYDYGRMIYEGSDDCEYLTGRLYKDYIYITLSDDSVNSSSGSKFIRVSVDSGKEEVISTEGIDYYQFLGNQIIYRAMDGNALYSMNLNGGNVHELTGIRSGSFSSFYVAGDYLYCRIYADSKSALYRYNSDGSGEKEIDIEQYGPCSVSSGLAYTEDNKLILLDFDGNVINEITP